MRNASPDYFVGQELIAAEMLDKINVLSDNARQSENFEQANLLAEEASVAAGVFYSINKQDNANLYLLHAAVGHDTRHLVH